MIQFRLISALVVAVSISSALATSAAAQDQRLYVWHEAIPGESVQYGVPDSDDRALRIDCEGPGKIAIMGPTASQAPEGGAVSVLLQTVGGPVRSLIGSVIGLGDGSNFHVVIKPGDPALTGLLTGKGLTVGSLGDSWTVPSHGANAPLTRLLAACAARKG